MHDIVETTEPFTQAARDRLNTFISNLTELYTKCVARGDHQQAMRQLRSHQREHIVWERDTVWRQMIGKARRGDQSDHVQALGALAQEDKQGSDILVSLPRILGSLAFTKKQLFLTIAVATFVALLVTQPLDAIEASRCLAILVFATILWATEVISKSVGGRYLADPLKGNSPFRDIDACASSRRLFPGHTVR
jgi:phosphate transporter